MERENTKRKQAHKKCESNEISVCFFYFLPILKILTENQAQLEG